MLEVKQVSKRYDGGRGVQNIDFSMQRGEIVGFLGPNGAGKTTTMRMITGYLYPTEGTITVDGLSVHDEARRARAKIGYLPETPPLYPDLTVEAYLKFVAKLRGVPAREQKLRIAEMVSRLGLNGREKQSVRHLSKGYKQRLGLAQAIIHQPDLLVLDEPTSGLDPSQIIEIRSLIRELGENHTVLLSTHILQEVGALCDRVLIINRGELVMDGAPDEIGKRMESRFAVSLEVRGERRRVERVLGDWASARGISAEIHRDAEGREAEPVEAGRVLPQDDNVSAALEPELEQSVPEQTAPDETSSVPRPVQAEQPVQSASVVPANSAVPADPASSADGSVRALLTADGHEDFRVELFRLLAEADLPILELHKENLTLEDVFLKLTADNAGSSPVESEAETAAEDFSVEAVSPESPDQTDDGGERR
ncbi:ABC transporter ATP-binding protein [Saccharibacillus sp. CPCC 101409]|uniref:ABC transporter ATP-binding protein n=1 Tax=Saccharibacillus sp. CPCC 101409 TaxID=3058041 RepID=UPI0026726F1E|nr:ABC transporter ATP-binding protein [Saccharibacillus sp. CPCC 101409]MDO3411220.1 ABC transporter ATP-binding protein [Saccharibacillus sp. CPCC 101409]